MYSTQTHQADSSVSVHKFKSFINTTFSPTFTLFAFHTNKKQYLDTLHKEKKKEMHIRMRNNDFDILLRSGYYLAKLQIAKIHKNVQK